MWTAPRTWVTGEIVTASQMNTHVRDNELALDHPIDVSTSDTIAQNTTVETSLYSVSIPAGSMGTTGLVIVDIAGDFQWNHTTGNTLTLRFKFGGTTWYTRSGIQFGNSIAPTVGGIGISIYMFNDGSTSQQRMYPSWTHGATSGGADPNFNSANGARGPGGSVAHPTIDTTAARILEVTAQWVNASAAAFIRKFYARTYIAGT